MMNDQTRMRLSIFLYASMFVLPGVGLAIGWVGWDFRTGVLAALIIFALCFVLAGLLLATVQDLSWIAVALPFSLGVVYGLLPNFVGPFDNAVVISAGALTTFGLWIRKQPDTPKWIVIPLLVSGVYTLVGTAIPGPVDELLVAAISTGTAVYGGTRRQLPSAEESYATEGADFIEGELLEDGDGA